MKILTVLLALSASPALALPTSAIIHFSPEISLAIESQVIEGEKICTVTLVRRGKTEVHAPWPEPMCESRWRDFLNIKKAMREPKVRDAGPCARMISIEIEKMRPETICLDHANRYSRSELTRWWNSLRRIDDRF